MVDGYEHTDDLRRFVATCFYVNEEAVPTLYHYTSVLAYKCIVESRCFWASDVRFLNDDNEIRYGYAKVKGAISSKIDDSLVSDVAVEALLALENNLFDDFGVCSVSFCTDGDLLSQWRGYGNEQGVSIGVNSEKIRKIEGFDIYRVIYEERRQDRIISDSIELYCRRYAQLKASGWQGDDLKHFGLQASYVFDRMIAAFKAPSFQEEGEVRAFARKYAHTLRRGVKFREKNGIIIPYYEMKIDDLNSGIISDVIIGPGRNLSVVKSGVEIFSKANKVNCDVYLSSIALRT